VTENLKNKIFAIDMRTNFLVHTLYAKAPIVSYKFDYKTLHNYACTVSQSNNMEYKIDYLCLYNKKYINFYKQLYTELFGEEIGQNKFNKLLAFIQNRESNDSSMRTKYLKYKIKYNRIKN
jgi:hypothetical protein